MASKKPAKKKTASKKASPKKTAKKPAAKKVAAKKSGAKKPARAAVKRAAPKLKKKSVRRTKAAAAPAVPLRKPNEAAHAMARAMAHAALDKKAENVIVLDVRGLASYADYIVVASGESQPQVRAMAEGIEMKLKENGNRPLSREGEDAGSWVLLDYGDVVAHLFDTDARSFYDLEGMYADAPRERVSA